MSGDYLLEGLAVPESLNLLHDLLEEVGQEHPELAPSDLMMFETAVIEVAGNVVEHGQPPGRVRWSFRLSVLEDRLEASCPTAARSTRRRLGHRHAGHHGGGRPRPGPGDRRAGLPGLRAVRRQRVVDGPAVLSQVWSSASRLIRQPPVPCRREAVQVARQAAEPAAQRPVDELAARVSASTRPAPAQHLEVLDDRLTRHRELPGECGGGRRRLPEAGQDPPARVVGEGGEHGRRREVTGAPVTVTGPTRTPWRPSARPPALDVALAVLQPLLARLAQAREAALGHRRVTPSPRGSIQNSTSVPAPPSPARSSGRRRTTAAATRASASRNSPYSGWVRTVRSVDAEVGLGVDRALVDPPARAGDELPDPLGGGVDLDAAVDPVQRVDVGRGVVQQAAPLSRCILFLQPNVCTRDTPNATPPVASTRRAQRENPLRNGVDFSRHGPGPSVSSQEEAHR